MNELLIYGLILGLTSNLHCIGMCGPIALAIPVNRTNNWTILVEF
jgi:sulfite exporter TauE/SafE